ncbi:MAG: peptide-methionine (R)-S-oxide reductase MsrB [Candidatus Saccharibacteria bacterium]|nr:peptide-methionine (R)-S-oxide reductase MsrB [Candidatus Saccharibacteria bacterium]
MVKRVQQINPTLTDQQKSVLFDKGTEAPFSGQFLKHAENGTYTCANCGSELFPSGAKYESDIPGLAGWPSFADTVNNQAISLQPDTSYGMNRVEAVCATCGGHLGHLFDDESSPTGQHYCISSASLGFKKGSKSEAS